MITPWKVYRVTLWSETQLILYAASTGQRPPNTYEKWVLQQRNSAQSKLTLESPEIAAMSTVRVTHSINVMHSLIISSPDPPTTTFTPLRHCWMRPLLSLLPILGTTCTG